MLSKHNIIVNTVTLKIFKSQNNNKQIKIDVKMTRSVEDFDTDWNKIADGVFYKLQTTQDDRLRFRWTDLVHVFEEDITTLEISNRFQKLNLSLTMPAREIIKEVENLLSEVPPSKIDNDTGSMRFQRSIEEL